MRITKKGFETLMPTQELTRKANVQDGQLAASRAEVISWVKGHFANAGYPAVVAAAF